MPKVVPRYTDDAKRRIVLSAMEAMAESGYENVTVDDVAKKIGVTKGAVYWYFRSKNDLIQEVLIAIENEIDKIASEPSFNRYDDRELPQAFDRVFFSEENRRVILSEIGLLVSPEDRIPEVTPESLRELVSALETGIEREQKNKTIRSLTDVKVVANALAVLCCGLQRGEIYARLFLGRAKIQRTWFFAIKLFLDPASLKIYQKT
jgi:AcrR family transcriptional regulator